MRDARAVGGGGGTALPHSHSGQHSVSVRSWHATRPKQRPAGLLTGMSNAELKYLQPSPSGPVHVGCPPLVRGDHGNKGAGRGGVLEDRCLRGQNLGALHERGAVELFPSQGRDRVHDHQAHAAADDGLFKSAQAARTRGRTLWGRRGRKWASSARCSRCGARGGRLQAGRCDRATATASRRVADLATSSADVSAYTTSTRCSSSSTAAALPKRSGKRAAAIWANRPAEKACSVSMYTTAPSSPPIDAGSVAATLAAKQNCVLPHPGGPTS